MSGVKEKSGGKRDGAGRPRMDVRCPSKTIRISTSLIATVKSMVRVSAEMRDKHSMLFLDEQENERRRHMLSELESIVCYEKNRMEKARQLQREEEENRRQLKLFD